MSQKLLNSANPPVLVAFARDQMGFKVPFLGKANPLEAALLSAIGFQTLFAGCC